jgi:hypothetical protein
MQRKAFSHEGGRRRSALLVFLHSIFHDIFEMLVFFSLWLTRTDDKTTKQTGKESKYKMKEKF